MTGRSLDALCFGKRLPHAVVFRFGPRSEATYLTNNMEEHMKKKRKVVTKSQKVDVYIHFLAPEQTKPRSAGAWERVRLLAIGSVASVMMAIAVARLLG